MLGGDRGASKGLMSIHGRSSGFVRALGRAFAPRDHRDGAAQRARQNGKTPDGLRHPGSVGLTCFQPADLAVSPACQEASWSVRY